MTFEEEFKHLTGNEPFPWQRALFEEYMANRFPKVCRIPPGLGKTATIPIWLLAMAHHVRDGSLNGFPRRLVYVVNRRTVVDQSTREAEHIMDALVSNPELKNIAEIVRSLAARPRKSPLAISTLRGQFADNAEWRADPARPAVIVGTVDMIGSRLLFSGYGCGFKTRPLHAGLLGQDALLIHDEAHLEPAYQAIIESIEAEQQRCNEFGRFVVMALTATSRDEAQPFELTDTERNPDSEPNAGKPLKEVWKRTRASKRIAFHDINGKDVKLVDEIIELALAYKDGEKAILVFLRKLEDVERAVAGLRKAKQAVQVLTGTLRGLERDALAREDAIFARFMPRPNVKPQAGAAYLVCTSAGEVGVDISADHLVCDLTPFDSMAQRFGRVNRFGGGDAKIDIVFGESKRKNEQPSPFDEACERTLALLKKLPQGKDGLHDASPAALECLPAADRLDAFTPSPLIPPASDILFDAWALTSIRQRLPGRPPVADWLHGLSDWEPPETRVAWREEVEVVTGDLLDKYRLQDLLDDYPLKTHEMLRDRSDRVFKHVKKLAERHSKAHVWLIGDDGIPNVLSLGELAAAGKNALEAKTVLLPPQVGGLDNGMFDGAVEFDPERQYDVADHLEDASGKAGRLRVWNDEEQPQGMRLVLTIDTSPGREDEAEEDEQLSGNRFWHWYVRPSSADDDGSRTASQQQELSCHLQSSESFACAIVTKLGLKDPEASAIRLAARWHDRGKHRAIWQRSIRNKDYPNKVLAKTGGNMSPVDLNHYRHEFGSLIDVSKDSDFRDLAPDMQDLVLHFIAAHHGRARPHFALDEAFDPQYSDEDVARVSQEVPVRFARLERRHGRWGLAYLESILRAADALASQEVEK